MHKRVSLYKFQVYKKKLFTMYFSFYCLSIGGDPPELVVEVLDQSLSITWSTNIVDILITIGTAINTNSGMKTSVIVRRDVREALIHDIETAAPYDVFVEIYDSCGNIFSSEPFHVNETLSSTFPSSVSSSDIEETHILSPTPESTHSSVTHQFTNHCFPSQQSDDGNILYLL